MTHSGFNPDKLGRSRDPINRFDPDSLLLGELQAIRTVRGMSNPHVASELDETLDALAPNHPDDTSMLRWLGALAFEQARRLER